MDRNELPLKQHGEGGYEPLPWCWCCPIGRCLFGSCLGTNPEPFKSRCMDCIAHCGVWALGMYHDPAKPVKFRRNVLNAAMQLNNAKPGINSKLQVRTADFTFPSTKTEKYQVPCRVYDPISCEQTTLRGVMVYFHGGGFCLGSAQAADMDLLCQKLCSRNKIVLVSVSYRLAPENPLPAAIHDCIDALRWVASKPPQLARAAQLVDSGVIVAGDSAGANLACVVSSLLRDGLDADLQPITGTLPQIKQQVLYYPPLFIKVDPELTKATPRSFLPEPMTNWFDKSYFPKFQPNVEITERRLCPLVAGFHNMPPTIFISAGRDVLQHNVNAANEEMKLAGVETVLLHYANVPHGFATFHFMPECDQAVEAISQALNL